MNRPMGSSPALTIWAALAEPFWHPSVWLTAWNWKAALGSAIVRAQIFFVINLSSDWNTALAAMRTEFLYRVLASGFYGGFTERLARATPARHATTTAMIVLPALAHVVEFVVHRAAGTVVLGPSIAGSVLFSVLSTRFNLFAMRHGALTVGPNRATLPADLRRLPRLVVQFVRATLSPSCPSEPST